VGTCSDDPNVHLAEPTSELQVELTYAGIGTLLGWRAGSEAPRVISDWWSVEFQFIYPICGPTLLNA
jgi:hypothetical protein